MTRILVARKIGPNRNGIWQLSAEKYLNVLELFIDSDREKNSASNEPIFVESGSGFSGLSGQKLVFRGSQRVLQIFVIIQQVSKNKVIFVISTLTSIELYEYLMERRQKIFFDPWGGPQAWKSEWSQNVN